MVFPVAPLFSPLFLNNPLNPFSLFLGVPLPGLGSFSLAPAVIDLAGFFPSVPAQINLGGATFIRA